MSGLPISFREQAYRVFDERITALEMEMVAYCESPIEVQFAVAFVLLGSGNYGEVAVHEPKHDSNHAPFPCFDWILKCQPSIGRYRADFIAGANPLDPKLQVVIECDGHNYHERTKQQAQRDRSRDREMQASGYRVFRFTGSEIYRDAFGCAAEVFEALLAMQDEFFEGSQ